MKQVELIRQKRTKRYVNICQILFVLFIVVLLARVVYNTGVNSPTSFSMHFVIFVVPFIVFLTVKMFGTKGTFHQAKPDQYINAFYLLFLVILLTQEKEAFFKLLFMMPPVASALQYGARRGYLWALLSSLGLIAVDFFQDAQSLDISILAMALIWLFTWLLGKMSDTEQDMRDQLETQVAVDGLTGLFNHRSFHRFFDEAFLQAKLGVTSLALMMIDVDFFKYYNEAYGHQKGDDILAKLAESIAKGAPDAAICCRYGGDEFALILSEYDNHAALEVGKNIRRRVEEVAFEGVQILPGGRFSVSVGVASFPENAETQDQLLERAEEALYRAKNSNNKVELYYSVFDEISHSLQDKEKDMLNSMRILMMVVNAKDRYTYGHSERVMLYAEEIGKRLSLWEWEIKDVIIGALLHDIGKIEVTREILNKAEKLTSEEWETIKNHSMWGADMIRPISAFHAVVDIVLYHHENYNGTGYPYSLIGTRIPIGARILRVADSFDAMVSNRPYKKMLSVSEALEDLQKYRGVYYDPDILDAFTDYILDTGVLAEAQMLN